MQFKPEKFYKSSEFIYDIDNLEDKIILAVGRLTNQKNFALNKRI